MMTMIKARPPNDAVIATIVTLASFMGIPQAALVELVALRPSTTVQFPALQVAAAVWNATSAHRQLISSDLQVVTGNAAW